ncbi:hypothetical protein BDZ45DRAFT_694129 [Acephala macrosclerotiorum]|nr:hypothetical protein BDZ45DRAFT_694129 [Acephala macrosclerotiorum]
MTTKSIAGKLVALGHIRSDLEFAFETCDVYFGTDDNSVRAPEVVVEDGDATAVGGELASDETAPGERGGAVAIAITSIADDGLHGDRLLLSEEGKCGATQCDARSRPVVLNCDNDEC